MITPVLSVITPTWNRRRLLLSLVSNMAEQIARSKVPVEHVVVSDGPDEVARLACDDRVVYRELPEHEGQFGSAVRDTGVAEAAGEWVWFCDDDDCYPPSSLETVTAAINPDLDMLIFQMRYLPPSNEWTVVPRQFTGQLHSGQIGTPCVVLRREFAMKETWLEPTQRYDNDFSYFNRILNHRPRTQFVEQVVAECISARMDSQ